MKILSIMLSAAGLLLAAGSLQAAESWNVTGEQVARFDAKVVDILCEAGIVGADGEPVK